jgi:hypothetical protein
VKARAYASRAVAVAAVASTLACNGSGPAIGDAGNSQQDGGGLDASAPADSGADAKEEAAAPQAFVRLAQWSTDAPAVDVCFTTEGGSFSGQTPALATRVATEDAGAPERGDAGAAGLTYPQVSSYLRRAPGSYALRLVTAGAADCSASVADLASVTLNDATYTTVIAVGDAAKVQSPEPLKLVSFADDVTAPGGQIALRFINASPQATSVDMGTGSLSSAGGAFAPLFVGVGFGLSASSAASDAGAVDANGYLALNPLAGATLSAHVSTSGSDTAVAPRVTVTAQSAATIAMIGEVSGNPARPPQLLQCSDGDDGGNTGLLSRCSIVSR